MIQSKNDGNDRKVTPYEVAQLVCLEGYTAASAARKLFPEEYKDKTKQAQAITKTKRLLQRAVRDKLIQLVPPKNERLMKALEERYDLMRSFTVIDDEGVPEYSTKDSPVFVAAAELIAERIKTLVRESDRERTIVVANAGGVTLGQVISYLPTVAEIPEGAERLRFISLNAARKADEYQYSANFLAVRMSQIYGGSHLAVINTRAARIDALYEESLENVDLVLTSTGTRKSFLYLWHEEERGGSWEIDERAVGDISFVLIDAKGKAVPVDDGNREFFEAVHEHLRPQPSHGNLVHLARQGKVLVVSAQLPPQFMRDHQGADYGPRARARVAHAVCVEGLASDCVLGSTVAEYLVDGSFAEVASRASTQGGALR